MASTVRLNMDALQRHHRLVNVFRRTFYDPTEKEAQLQTTTPFSNELLHSTVNGSSVQTSPFRSWPWPFVWTWTLSNGRLQFSLFTLGMEAPISYPKPSQTSYCACSMTIEGSGRIRLAFVDFRFFCACFSGAKQNSWQEVRARWSMAWIKLEKTI